MATFYKPQATQMNKESPRESSLGLTLTHHPRDENLESQEVCLHFKVESP
jgi:hypothetical protein